MRVAVLGSGLTGTLVSLELADAGMDVCLFDRQERAFSGASLACEGKVHHGYVFAMDRSRRTAMTMLRGCAVFQRLVARWTGSGLFEKALSKPFLYAVPHDSFLPVDAISAHFDAVNDAMVEFEASALLPRRARRCRQLDTDEYAGTFDPDLVAAVFQTEERAVDTAVLAKALRAALDESGRIEQRMGCQVASVASNGAGYFVRGAGADGDFSETFDIVVNALWEHRLLVDTTLGLPADKPVIHRFKYGAFARRAEIADSVPSVTFVSGAYGDTVAFSENAYVSWYPSVLVSHENTVRPRTQEFVLTAEAREQMISGTMRNLRRLMPGSARFLTEDPEAWTLRGGFVTAWGNSGIEDPRSRLHERFDVGVFSRDNYHSVDTGKFTTAPLFASEVCDRIFARHGRQR